MISETLTRTQIRWFMSLRDGDGEVWFDEGRNGPRRSTIDALVNAGVAHEAQAGRLVISSRGKRAQVTTSGRLIVPDDEQTLSPGEKVKP